MCEMKPPPGIPWLAFWGVQPSILTVNCRICHPGACSHVLRVSPASSWILAIISKPGLAESEAMGIPNFRKWFKAMIYRVAPPIGNRSLSDKSMFSSFRRGNKAARHRLACCTIAAHEITVASLLATSHLFALGLPRRECCKVLAERIDWQCWRALRSHPRRRTGGRGPGRRGSFPAR